MTIIRVAQEAGGLTISVEGSDGTPTTVVLGGVIAGPLAIVGPVGSSTDNPPARPRRGWLLGSLCFVVAIGVGIVVTGRHSAIGANAGAAQAAAAQAGASLASAGAIPGSPLPAAPAAYAAQWPAPGQLPPAIASAFAQTAVVVPPPGEAAGPSAPAGDTAPTAIANPGAIFGLNP